MEAVFALGCVGLFLTVFVAATGLWFYVHRLGSPIAMDGTTCLQTRDGSVLIRKRNLRNVLALVFLGLCLLGLVAMMVSFASQIVSETAARDTLPSADLVGMLPDACELVGAGAIVVSAMVVLVLALRKPSIRVDAGDRAIAIGRGAASQRIPFSELSCVTVDQVRQYDAGDAAMAVFAIVVTLRDGSPVGLGTVSGDAGKARARAEAIAQRVADVAGVPPRKEGA
jgi:hypothetical protein